MLYDVESDKIYDSIPHLANYTRWCTALQQYNPQARQCIDEELARRLDEKEIINSSWEAGREWKEPFDAIWYACANNEDNAAMFWGLLLLVAVQHHPLDWGFMSNKEPLQGDRPPGKTYFRITRA